MTSTEPPFSIVLPTVYGRMIVNRHDSHRTNALMKTGRAPDHADIVLLSNCLRLLGGEGMVVDVGANVGTHTLAFAATIGGARKVHAFEAQRIVFCMLAGSVVLNGLTNVHCHHVALSDHDGRVEIPQFDYSQPMNFGAVEFGRPQTEALAQTPGSEPGRIEYVALARLDDFEFSSVALIKIDVEGMEMQVLDGAVETIRRSRPILYIEFHKVDYEALRRRIEAWDYVVHLNDINYLCLPTELAGLIPLRAVGATEATRRSPTPSEM